MITASAVQELRKITNAGMMACKKALTETEGDLDAAVKLLREKGIVKSAGRADRETSEGLVATHVSCCGENGVLVEVNCETDFVAKNEDFGAFVSDITKTIAESDATDAEAAVSVSYTDGTIQDALGAKFSQLGEVIKVKQITRFTATGNGAVSSYMHIAASSPSGLTRDDIDASVIEEEKDISRKQLIAEGKPEQIIEKILVGKINKFYSERCLVDQAFVKDDKVSITELLAAKSKELGDTVAIARYVRFSIGG
jgi:elongation factor Ts